MNAWCNRADLAKMLGSVPCYQSLQQMSLQAIVTSGQVRYYAKGHPHFHKSAPPETT